MPVGQAASRFGPGIFTRDPLKGHTVSRSESISFLFFFFFVVVATNLYINLFIKPSLHSGCTVLIVFNQSRPIKSHSCRVYRKGGDPLPLYLGDVKASFDSFIKTGLKFVKHAVDFSNGSFTILKR